MTTSPADSQYNQILASFNKDGGNRFIISETYSQFFGPDFDPEEYTSKVLNSSTVPQSLTKLSAGMHRTIPDL